MTTTIDEVKNYWEKNTPQYWHSNKEQGTLEYFKEIEKKRYAKVKPYLYKTAEFEKHKGENVLEIGCGQGTDLIQYAKNGAIVTGIDLTEGAIKKSRKFFETYNLKADLRTRNSEDLGCFGDNSFDLVYSFGVLHHTPKTKKAIEEVHRVLKPNGKTIIMLYSKGISYYYKVMRYHILGLGFLKHSAMESVSLATEYKRKCPLATHYSRKEIMKLFENYRKVSVERLCIPHFYLHRIKMPQFLYHPLEKIWGDHFIIKASK